MPITQYNSSVRQMSQSKFNSMKNASGKIPDLANQIVMTNSEDENYDYLRMKLLWTNSNPTGAFIAQTISIDLSNYDLFLISFNIRPLTRNIKYSEIMHKGDTDLYLIGVDLDGNRKNRSVSINNAGITFGSSSTDYTDEVVPYQIYGILKTPSMIYTGEELIAGNGIKINNGTINASSMTTLWTNPNPTNAFPAQTITLSSDDYDYLIIRCSGRRPFNNEEDPIWQTYMIKKGDTGLHMFIIVTANTSEYRGEIMERIANNITPTSIHFNNANYMQNSTTNSVSIDYIMIPQQVIGVKVV